MRLIDQGLTPLSSAEIRVALLPIGHVPEDVLSDYQSMIEKYRHVRNDFCSLQRRMEENKDLVVRLSSVRSFHHEKQKSPFKHLPWSKGCLNFRFLTESTLRPSSLSCLYASRAILGVIGICHCPSSPNIPQAYLEFESICKQFPNSVTLRCFAFDPLNDEISEGSKQKEHLIMFPKCDRTQLEQNVEVLMHDFAACLLMELQQGMLNLSVSMMNLSSIVDQPDIFGYSGTTEEINKRLGTEEEVKLRRRHARMQKLFGDWSMLAGSPKDAFEHYNTCLELARFCGDIVWGAAAVEGMAEAKILEALIEEDAIPQLANGVFDEEDGIPRQEQTLSSSDQNDDLESPFEDASVGFGGKRMWQAIKRIPNLLDEVLAFYNEAETVYSKREIVPLQIEVEMKTVRLHMAFDGNKALARINNILTRVLEQWVNLKSEHDRSSIVVEVSKILKMMGLARKRALLLWEALDSHHLFQKTDSQILSLVLKSEENLSLTKVEKEVRFLTSEVFKTPNWLPLQKAMVDAILPIAMKAGLSILVWESAATLLREFFNVMLPDRQQALIDIMKQASEKISEEDKKRNSSGPPPYFQARNVCYLSDSRKPYVCDELRDQNGDVESTDGPFIFNPYAMKRQSKAKSEKEERSRWVVGEECSLEVYISNPCAVQLKIERLSLCIENNHTHPPLANPISVAVVLPPKTKPTRVSLSVIPNVAGPLRVIGCHVTLFGIMWVQRFVRSLRRVPRLPSAYFMEPEWGTDKNMVLELDIVPSMPLLKWQLRRTDSKKLWPTTIEDVPKSQAASHHDKDNHMSLYVRLGQILDFILRLTNVSNLEVHRARSIHEGKNKISKETDDQLRMEIDENHLIKSLPLLPGAVVEVPVRVRVGNETPSKNSIPSKIRIQYGGPQSDAQQTAFGRELCAPFLFKVLDSVNIINVQMTEQSVPLHHKSSFSRCRSGMITSDSIRRNNSATTGSSGVLDNSISTGSLNLDVTTSEESKLITRAKSTELVRQNTTILREIEEIYKFQSEAVLKITIGNQDTQVLCVWVGKNIPQDIFEGHRWLPPPAPESHSVVPGQAVQVSCVIPEMQKEQEILRETKKLDVLAAEWIMSCLSGFWQSVVHQPTFTEKDAISSEEPVFALNPGYGAQGFVPLHRDQISRVLNPNLISLILKSDVVLSIQLAEPFTRGFVDLKSFLSNQGDMTSLLEAPGIDESLEEWTIQAPEYNQPNPVLESNSSHQPELPSTPRGPNGEIWGVEMEVGEFLSCEVVVRNNTNQDLDGVSLSICSERLDQVGDSSDILFRREGGINDTGILLVGSVSNIPVICKSTSIFHHQFCFCCLMPGLYNIYVCEQSTTPVEFSFVQGFRLNVFCRFNNR